VLSTILRDSSVGWCASCGITGIFYIGELVII